MRRERPVLAVALAVAGSVCATLITNALNWSPTVRLVGAAIAAAVPALLATGGRHGAVLATVVTVGALGVTYIGFSAADPETFPGSKDVKEVVNPPPPSPPPPAPPPQEEVEVPNVVGEQYADALAKLQDVDLATAREDVESAEPPQTVVDQDPEAETRVPKGTTITLSVSREPGEAIDVPDVVGQTRTAARTSLENDHWVVVVIETETEVPSQDGIVLSQTPNPGEQAEPGSKVTIHVGKFQIP